MGNKKNPKDNSSEFSDIESDLLDGLGCKTWEEVWLESKSSEQGPDFDCVGSRDAFFLNPKTVSAVVWVNLNLGFPNGGWGCQVQVDERDVVLTLKTILEDGLSFSKTLH
ncbi:hypothetical protein N9V12_02175 [Gammaproteobacteria bacterium]|nr:hypothetical protein [Gammaproteobacteria bacterium]